MNLKVKVHINVHINGIKGVAFQRLWDIFKLANIRIMKILKLSKRERGRGKFEEIMAAASPKLMKR